MKIDKFQGDYRFLSNFYVGEPIIYTTNLFDSAEHLYMALKTTDFTERAWVASAPTPGEAKRRGQQVTLRDGWDEGLREEAMRITVGAKFLQDHRLQDKLIATGDATLIEGNTWHDQVWGDCSCGREECSAPGANLLGVLLMKLRSDLRKWV